MKKFTPFLTLILVGCSNLPKDALIKDAEITTPWGHTSASVIATGKAAQNLTAEERDSIVKHTTKK